MADSEDETLTESQQTNKDWISEINRAEKWFGPWWLRADKLLRLYRKQRSETEPKRKFAMLWANTEVLKPSVYAREPVPQVSRRFKDSDAVGRKASEMLERVSIIEIERSKAHASFQLVRDDLLLPGRGVAWVRYEADIDNEQLEDQMVKVDYVHFKQFIHEPARYWEEVNWIAKIAYMTNSEGKKRFREKWKNVQLDKKRSTESGQPDDDPNKGEESKAAVYEIWDKKTKRVYFVNKSAKDLLDEIEPPLELDSFWPCPKPVYATLTSESLIPSPDYAFYQDQAEEIDDLTARIASLTDSLKLVGFYPAGADGDISEAISRALDPATENVMIAVPSWAAFAEKGGTNQIAWLPIKDVAETIRACVELRTQLIQDVYQISGISDIQRGSSDPNETLGAQQLKAQNGAIRIRDKQGEMARFCRDIIRIMCEIVAEHYEPKRILQMANMVPQPSQDPQQDQQAIAELEQVFTLMKDERLRGFRIDIETDSTIQPDEDAEKQRRIEFVEAMGLMLQQSVPALEFAPEIAPMIGEMMMFVARGFRAGRMLEESIEQTMAKVAQRLAQQAENPQPDPKVQAIQMKAEADMKAKEADIQIKQQTAQMDQQSKAQEIAFKREEAQIDMQTKLMELQMKMKEMQMQLQGMAMDAQMKQVTAQMDMAVKREEQNMNMEAAQEEHQLSMSAKREEHALNKKAMADKNAIAAKAMKDKAAMQKSTSNGARK